MNKLFWNPDQMNVPTKFDHDPRRIAPMRVVTGLAGQNN